MPRKVAKGGTEGGEQSRTEYYKKLINYKELVIFDDAVNREIQNIYNNNVWDLKNKFEELKLYYEQVGISDIISWNEGVQYLDFNVGVPLMTRPTSLSALKRGDYKSIGTELPNKINTEKKYHDRIIFFIKTFQPFQQYQNNDSYSWILPYNRLLFNEILKYHNTKNNQLSSLNNDLKTLVRALKTILINPDNEIVWKYSALQIALRDLESLRDDLNQVLSVNELKSFIPYEQLLDVVDKLEEEYERSIPLNIKNDYRQHSNDTVFLNQLLIAVAIMVLDYPSRLDKFEMEIITDEKDIKSDKCYILITNPLTFIFNNDKKHHKPLKYKLNAKPILGLNKRLNKIISDSLIKYPRRTLFIKKDTWSSQLLTPVSEDTVAGWIKNLIPNKTLNVGTFRSAFVSYYYPKSNNQAKKIMSIRMRTSQFESVRAYLKFYDNPDTLAKVKLEPDVDLIERAQSGHIDTPIIVGNNDTIRIKQEPNDVPINISKNKKPRMETHERKRLTSKKWYEEHKEHHKEKVRSYSNKPDVIKKRYIRELNNGLLNFDKLKKETIDKYDIKYDNNKKLYY